MKAFERIRQATKEWQITINLSENPPVHFNKSEFYINVFGFEFIASKVDSSGGVLTTDLWTEAIYFRNLEECQEQVRLLDKLITAHNLKPSIIRKPKYFHGGSWLVVNHVWEDYYEIYKDDHWEYPPLSEDISKQNE